ncbi:MAG: hypothetical protein KDB03_15905 [Planctomycetales bacterium]|nr:hypothetical protein [Planctomycetales bacterium]
MKKLVACLLGLVLLSSTALAQSGGKNGKDGNQAQRMVATLLKNLEPAGLNAEQKQKIEELYSKVAKDVSSKRKEAKIPNDVFKKRQAASEEAKAAGKKGKALQEAVNKAIGLSDEQVKIWNETNEAMAKAKLEVGKLLTAEQIDKVEKPLKTALTAKAPEEGKKKGKGKQDA